MIFVPVEMLTKWDLQYQHPEAFTDITIGSNPGCGSPGFPAAPGWDPVTGLG